MTSFKESGNLFDSHFDDPADEPDNYWKAQRTESREGMRAPRQSEEITEIRMNLGTAITQIDRAYNPKAKPKPKYAS